MLRKYQDSILLILLGLVGAASGILSNAAASTIPEGWKPYLWLAWPLFGVLTLAGIGLAIWQGRAGGKTAADPDLIQAQRNRKAMLNLVYNTWVEGLLKKSLYNEVLIDLKMATQPEAVEHPWSMVVRLADQAPVLIPPGKKMLEVFEEASEALLILGEPGSGKTTMLLELARQAIERALSESERPIPVVFNLSSWSPKQTIADWLVSELRGKYYIAEKTSRHWVERDELMLLLDGLDEVKSEQRAACAQAINTYLETHPVPSAVCSRRREYEELAGQLRLRSAVLIQPLTAEQINWYLRIAGRNLEMVYQVLKEDAELEDFIRTPLALSILMLMYREVSAEEAQGFASAQDRRKYLFDTYIRRMFERRGASRRYSPEQTRHWLTYLAKRMTQKGQSILYIESIDDGWFRTITYAKQFRRFIGFFCGLLVGLPAGLVFAPQVGLVAGLAGGLGVWLLGSTGPIEKIRWSWADCKSGIVTGMLVGLPGWLLGELLFGWHDLDVFKGMTIVVFCGMMGGLLLGFTGSEVENRSQPGQGIRSSLKNALLFTLLFGIPSGLLGWWLAGLAGGQLYGLTAGVLIGLFFSLVYGGLFLISHYVVRWVLRRERSLPWDLIGFLDYAVERIFLRRVGGGYIFVHRMLMEHFAAMEADQAG